MILFLPLILFSFISWILLGLVGLVFFLLLVITTVFIFSLFIESILVSFHGAYLMREADNPNLFEIIKKNVQRMKFSQPKIYLIPDHSPNLFVIGKSSHHSALFITKGLIEALNAEELEAVISSELYRLKSKKSNKLVIYATLAALILKKFKANESHLLSFDKDLNPREELGFLSKFFILPFCASLVKASVDVDGFFIADKKGSETCSNKNALAQGLVKIDTASRLLKRSNLFPAVAQLYFINPFFESTYFNLFETHPSTVERIKKIIYSKELINENKSL